MSESIVEIKGMRELYIALSTQIPRKMEPKLLQKALAAGTAIVVQAAKNNIRGQLPEGFVGPTRETPSNRTGTLKRAIYAGRGKTSDTFKEVRIVNIRRGKRAAKSSRDAYYGRMVEYGHRTAKPKQRLIRDTRALTKKGFDRYERRRARAEGEKGRIRGSRTWGYSRPHPFIRPAWDATQVVATERVYQKLAELIDQAVKASRF